MSDRFKFRAWDEKRCEMVYFDFHLLNNESQPFYKEQIEGNPIMQCTGLKDKNGKLIYEGDLIKEGHGEIFKIEFHPRTASFIRAFQGDSAFCFAIDSIKAERSVIVGNIYERSQL